MQGNDVQSGGVQRMAVFPLGELRPRPSWYAGGSRVMDIRGRRGNAAEGTALIQVDHGLREGGGGSVTWRVGRKDGEAKATAIARQIRKE
jgi:hypothetical protein